MTNLGINGRLGKFMPAKDGLEAYQRAYQYAMLENAKKHGKGPWELETEASRDFQLHITSFLEKQS
jgi:hypothetical protein